MAIKIHHGPPGSYKTGGAMGDDFLREAKAGRVIVTNVRGVSRERTLEEFPDLPESFDVIHVSDKTSEGREKWANWFHWVPHGAFIFVDEVQDIWPKRWRESDIRALDYPGGIDQATLDDRPKDWEQALDKHRHWNWDMTLTCPSYAKVRDDVKGIADMAYKHKDLGLLGWNGRYIEGAHAADDTGKNASDFLNVENKKVPQYVFKLYDSTQTGVFSFTKSGFNIFKSPRIVMLLVVLLGCLGFVASRPMPSVFGGPSPNVDAVDKVAGTTAAPSGHTPRPDAASRPVPESVYPDARLEPFVEEEAFIVMSYLSEKGWKYSVTMGGQLFTSNDLLDMGYKLTLLGACGVKISRHGFQRVIICGRPQKHEQSDRMQDQRDRGGDQPQQPHGPNGFVVAG